MSDFLSRLADRALGVGPRVRPIVPSRFAPVRGLSVAAESSPAADAPTGDAPAAEPTSYTPVGASDTSEGPSGPRGGDAEASLHTAADAGPETGVELEADVATGVGGELVPRAGPRARSRRDRPPAESPSRPPVAQDDGAEERIPAARQTSARETDDAEPSSARPEATGAPARDADAGGPRRRDGVTVQRRETRESTPGPRASAIASTRPERPPRVSERDEQDEQPDAEPQARPRARRVEEESIGVRPGARVRDAGDQDTRVNPRVEQPAHESDQDAPLVRLPLVARRARLAVADDELDAAPAAAREGLPRTALARPATDRPGRATAADDEGPAPIVRITIGRVEVRSMPPAATPRAPSPRPERSTPSLDAYLDGRSDRRGR